MLCRGHTWPRLCKKKTKNQPVEEWVGAVSGHGPGVLGHGGGHGVSAAILIQTGRQLIPQSELLWTTRRKKKQTHEEDNQPRP